MAKQLPTAVDRRSEVFIISGFLGAGKTTLLKRILSWESDLSETVVLVNEFGEVGIDGSLLKDAGSDVVELTGGCICCTLKADLNLTLKKVWRQFKPRRIFIETTGVADPFMVTDIFDDAELHDQMKVFKVITVLDVELWEARGCFGTVFTNQLRQADLILLNKVDVADENKISQFLEEIHVTVPHSQVVPSIHCNVDPEIVLAGRSGVPQLFNYDELNHHHHDHAHHGHGHNHAHGDHLHSHMHHEDEAADLQVLATQFIEGFLQASDKSSYLKLAGVPFERPAKDGAKSLKLIDVELKTDWQVGTASPSFGSRELSYLPFPGEMVQERTNMSLIYVSMDEKSIMDIRDFLHQRKQEIEA